LAVVYLKVVVVYFKVAASVFFWRFPFSKWQFPTSELQLPYFPGSRAISSGSPLFQSYSLRIFPAGTTSTAAVVHFKVAASIFVLSGTTSTAAVVHFKVTASKFSWQARHQRRQPPTSD
jgi:hypothetical protein